MMLRALAGFQAILAFSRARRVRPSLRAVAISLRKRQPSSLLTQKRGMLAGTATNFCSASPRVTTAGPPGLALSKNTIAFAPIMGAWSQRWPQSKFINTIASAWTSSRLTSLSPTRSVTSTARVIGWPLKSRNSPSSPSTSAPSKPSGTVEVRTSFGHRHETSNLSPSPSTSSQPPSSTGTVTSYSWTCTPWRPIARNWSST